MKQTKVRKRVTAALCALLATVSLTACGEADPEPADAVSKAEPVKLTLSEVTHSVFYAPQYAAIELGYFADEGIELELINGEGADKVMASVLSGDADIGFAGPEATIYVYNEGKEDYMQVVAQVTQRDGAFILSREEEPDFDWSELSGKTLLPGRAGGVPYMTLQYVCRHKGIDDVIFDNSVQFSMMASAFIGGTGDYVALFEPTASSLVAEGKGHIVASVGAESGEIPYTAYFASKSWLQKNDDVMQRFVNALYKGQQWVASHTAEEIAKTIAPSFPDSDLELLTSAVESYRSIDAWCATPVMSENAFERLQTVMSEAGELSEKAPYGELVNNKYAEQAVAGQGK